MNTRTAQISCVLFSLCFGLIACGGNADQDAKAFPPPPVTVMTVTPQDLPVEREYTGQTKGSREVEIRPRVAGIIEKRFYAEGTPVVAGKILFQIDPRPYEMQLAATEATLARALAQYKQAERERTRLKPLMDEKLISRKTLDDAQSAFELAAADVKAAEAVMHEARLQIDYTRVTAPVSGIAGLAEKVEGALVKANEDRLTTLTNTDPMDVYFSVSENELLAQQQQTASGSLQTPAANTLQVKVRLADGRLLDRVGHINFSDARIDAATGTLSMRAGFPNADGVLKSGQFVRVIVNGATRPNAVVIPQKAVLEGPKGKFVYLAVKGKDGATLVSERPVVVGEWLTHHNEPVWLIYSGLHAGDQVILDNLIKLHPNSPVQIVAPTAPAVPAIPQPPN